MEWQKKACNITEQRGQHGHFSGCVCFPCQSRPPAVVVGKTQIGKVPLFEKRSRDRVDHTQPRHHPHRPRGGVDQPALSNLHFLAASFLPPEASFLTAEETPINLRSALIRYRAMNPFRKVRNESSAESLSQASMLDS